MFLFGFNVPNRCHQTSLDPKEGGSQASCKKLLEKKGTFRDQIESTFKEVRGWADLETQSKYSAKNQWQNFFVDTKIYESGRGLEYVNLWIKMLEKGARLELAGLGKAYKTYHAKLASGDGWQRAEAVS
jgi:hypothetical protein